LLSPVRESIQRHNDAILKTNHVYKKSMTGAEFRKLAESSKHRNPRANLRGKDIELYYFENMSTRHPIYGADTEGSFYDEDVVEFNMKQLGTILDDTKNVIKGVNSVYLYFGMYGASFAWHVEDMELYSINYLHYGSPKYWFAVPPEASARFERLMRQQFPAYDRQCKAFIRHKNFIVLPSLLDLHKIPYGTMTQYPNEFIITFPHGYHMGFNLGYNIAESTNFATDRWIDFGKNAMLCKCRSDMVEIDMTPFMKKYRKNKFEKWYSYWYLPMPTKDAPSKRLPRFSIKTVRKGQKLVHGSKLNLSSFNHIGRNRTERNFCPLHIAHEQETRDATLTLTINYRFIHLAALWSNQSTNFSAEKTFNQSIARLWPHCAVCQYFQPLHITTSSIDVPQRSARLAFGLCFAKDERRLPIVDLSEDVLVTCSNCCVSVHPSCYGGGYSISVMGTIQNWRCFRCRGRNEIAIRGTSCHLCELRGGALVPCRAGADICAYVHTACAIFNRRTVFNDATNPSCCYTHPPPKQAKYLPREYVFAMGDDYESSRYQCDLCGHSREGLIRCSACDDDDDPVLAHATCARQAGFLFERRAFPLVTVMICDRHQAAEVEPLMDVDLGDIVIAWMDGGSRVQQGKVERLVLRTLLTIDFEDGSVSENTMPSDIVQCGCIKRHGCPDGQHQPGSRVKVRWNDGQVYDGYYRFLSKTIEYTVVFADGYSYRLPRTDL
ncbi:hypothetical protein Angca_007185, partial [Angiostrongylus cantonensis]